MISVIVRMDILGWVTAINNGGITIMLMRKVTVVLTVLTGILLDT